MAAFRCIKTAPWPGRRENVMFNKRRCSLFKKANELSGKTGRELYIVMHRGRYFTYNSTDRSDGGVTDRGGSYAGGFEMADSLS